MQEKDIREKLNKELEEMAPDMLQKILDTPIEPIKSEKELFGETRSSEELEIVEKLDFCSKFLKKGDKEFINKLLALVITYMNESRKE